MFFLPCYHLHIFGTSAYIDAHIMGMAQTIQHPLGNPNLGKGYMYLGEGYMSTPEASLWAAHIEGTSHC